MRAAIITQLKTITGFSNRVYQPYAAPSNVSKPYCVAKIADDLPDLINKFGSVIALQVFIYESVGKATSLDSLEISVRKALHKVTLTTDESPARYFTPEFVQVLSDLKDDTLGLIFKRLEFKIAGARA